MGQNVGGDEQARRSYLEEKQLFQVEKTVMALSPIQRFSECVVQRVKGGW